MPDITWTDDFLPLLMRDNIIPLNVRSVVDVGCGRGVIGCMLRVYREPKQVVGIDVFRPYLRFADGLGAYDSVLELDLAESRLPFPDSSIDIVLCLEVIEHLNRERGFAVLSELERVGRRVVVSTPGRFFEQKRYDDNPTQEHHSLYSTKDFRGRGYEVYGIRNLHPPGRYTPRLSVITRNALIQSALGCDIILAIRK